MLIMLIQNQVTTLTHQLLYGVLDELVERIQLLPNEPFCVEERSDDIPAVFLGDSFFLILIRVEPITVS